MNKLRTALIESYAGAILIAFLANTGITGLLQQVATAIVTAVMKAKGQEPNWGWEVGIFGAVNALVCLLIAFLILRWLYFPVASEPASETDLPPAQESSES